jgi:hypothetical protein
LNIEQHTFSEEAVSLFVALSVALLPFASVVASMD